MENQETHYSIYYILGLIGGILTALAYTHEVLWLILGALSGLIFTVFYVNVLVEGRGEA
ncbi:MAG TPA: hypothetical protein VEV16_01180 [Daejeonella sp.]|nr:hypothetical protein [Daejeonella sp.]